ncbi:hypothetical protein TIFTF001_045144 [Ficus carica]|uniref:S-protein homolog n=1 Tax=Ficus carica TaxID=3494 RepID=A0AA88CH18_FICCA|nr:hypothetical protein TIFTF001_045144 [Ficus carica]
MAPSILKTKNVMFLLAILLVLHTTMCSQPRAFVTITNSLNGTVSTAILNVHIKSKDDDLGWHAIPDGGYYEFSFHPRMWGGTLFFARMVWLREFHYFDIYVQDRDQINCDHCCWFVYPSGPCRCPCDDPTSYAVCFLWDQ